MTAVKHAEHWQEPSAVTAERPKTDKVCEFCGEDVPWHRASCSMLKNAYKRRFAKCTFCVQTHLVGDTMRKHVEDKHQRQLRELISGKEV